MTIKEGTLWFEDLIAHECNSVEVQCKIVLSLLL